MEIYILSNIDLSIQSVCKPCNYTINQDEETNGKSEITLPGINGAKKGYYLVINGLHRPFYFLIDDVNAEKGKSVIKISALDISNIFDRKVISKNLDTMTADGIEDFIADTILANFINSSDTILNIDYIDIYIHSHTQSTVDTNEENGLYNFHTFLINCRQNKNIYCDFSIVDKRLKIDIENKVQDIHQIDTTVDEVTNYNKIYDVDVCAKVTVLIREDNSEYNLYLKTDRTTTTNQNDPNRANGRIEVISVDTADKAEEAALNVIKGNQYKHLVEFNIANTSKLVDIKLLDIGTPIKIKTTDDIYDSYISAITINDTQNFVSYKSGNLRIAFIDKIKQEKKDKLGNKLDVSGGKILGNLDIDGNLTIDGSNLALYFRPIGSIYKSTISTSPATLFGGVWVQLKDRFLLGAGDTYGNGNTGGESTHALTGGENGQHNHSISHTHWVEGYTGDGGNHNHYIRNTAGTGSGGGNLLESYSNSAEGYRNCYTNDGGNHNHYWGATTGGASAGSANSGSGTGHNNMPPYRVVYMWYRSV